MIRELRLKIRSGRLFNLVGIGLLKGMSYLPFWVLYLFADGMSLLLQYLVGYRRKTVRTNLTKAYPEKSLKEIRRIERGFYRHLCDIFVETIKAWSMSRESFDKRLKCTGTELMNACFDQGKSVILLGMHYNNWEWAGFTQVYLKHRYLAVFNPVRGNPAFEKFLLSIRERWGATTIPVFNSARSLIDFHRRNILTCLVLGADQRPAKSYRFWTTFFNQEASFSSGPQIIAQRTNQPVFFHLARKLKRGHYEMSFIPLIEEPGKLSEEQILLRYVRTMEKYINEKPEYYLWSHKRWKQQRPDDCELVLDAP